MIQFQQPVVRPHLHQRCHCWMMESRVGLFDHLLQIDIVNLSAHKGRHHRKSHFCVGLASKRSNLIEAQFRPRRGHVEPAVTGQTRQQRLVEGKRRRLSACRYVSHVSKTYVLGVSA